MHFESANYGGIGTLITTTDGLNNKKVIIGAATATTPAVAGAMSGSFLTAIESGIEYDSTNKIFTVGDGRSDTGVVSFTIKAVTGGYTIENQEGKYLDEPTSKNLGFSDDPVIWTIEISNGTATIHLINDLQFNNSSPRFKTYDSTQKTIELYEYASYYDEATEYAELFIKGDTNNTCAETIENWDGLGDAFALMTDGAQNMFKIATHLEPSSYTTADQYTIEHAVARYDDALLKHPELRDNEFMGRVEEGTLKYSSYGLTSFISIGGTNYSTSIIIIITIISLSSLGGYFFIRRRREH